MRLGDQPESQNVIDRRGGMGARGGMGLLGGIGAVILVLLGLVFGFDPTPLLGFLGGGGGQVASSQQGAPGSQSPEDEKNRKFVAQVLGSTEEVWTGIFNQAGRRYQPPKLVLFSGQVQSACGMAQSATGPFYCPADQNVYLDTAFFNDMQKKLGAPGDFPRAYVIAHEIGHHVQALLGIVGSAPKSNDQSVRVELQADCLAGVWASKSNSQRGILEQGDVEQGINAATAIGDDRLQMRSRGYVVPDSFTHGSSKQRATWFMQGLKTGDINKCDTFRAAQL